MARMAFFTAPRFFGPPKRRTWAAPRFPDRRFGAILCRCMLIQVLVEDLLRSPVSESRVKTSPIIPQLDVPGNCLLRFLPGRVDGPVNQLDLNRRIHRLGQGIVIAYPGPAHGLPYPELFQDGGELSRCVITPAVAVKDGAGRESEITGRHLDRRGDQWCLVIIVHCPADHLARGAVNYGREVKAALPRRDVRNIAYHFIAVGAVGAIT